jgi:hypothetical protein
LVAALVATLFTAVFVAGQGNGMAERRALPQPSISLRANVDPRALPKDVRAPVRLTLAGELESGAGGGTPVLDELRLDLDRDLGFDPRPFSACGGATLDRIGAHDDPDQVRAKCRSSIVAEGTIMFLLAYPENTPIPVKSDLTLLMGKTRGGITTTYLHAYLPIPRPTAVVAKAELKKIRDSRYGTRAIISIPKLASGYGEVTSFQLTIPRHTLATGEPHSTASLRCKHGNVRIRMTSVYESGARTTRKVARPCTTLRGPRASSLE